MACNLYVIMNEGVLESFEVIGDLQAAKEFYRDVIMERSDYRDRLTKACIQSNSAFYERYAGQWKDYGRGLPEWVGFGEED